MNQALPVTTSASVYVGEQALLQIRRRNGKVTGHVPVYWVRSHKIYVTVPDKED